jgi:hypothetical protein
VSVNVTEKDEEVELPYLEEGEEGFPVTYTYSVSWSENKKYAFPGPGGGGGSCAQPLNPLLSREGRMLNVT